MIRQEQCDKVCRILDDVLANRPTERDSLIITVRKAFEALEAHEGRWWRPVTETPPLWDDLMLKVHDRRCSLDSFNYYVMGFHDGKEFQTYLFRRKDDHDIEIVGWQLCQWKGEEE